MRRRDYPQPDLLPDQVNNANATAPAGAARFFTSSATTASVLVSRRPARSRRRHGSSLAGCRLQALTRALPWLSTTTSRSTTLVRNCTASPRCHISTRSVSPG